MEQKLDGKQTKDQIKVENLVSKHSVFIINYFISAIFFTELFQKKRLSAVFIKNVVGKCADLGAPSRGDSGVSFLSDGFSQLSLRFIVVQWKNKKNTFFIPFSCHHSWLFHLTIVGG